MIKAYLLPNCGTCRSAKKWLEQNNISFQEIHIKEQPPSKEELHSLLHKSGLPIKKFFNTSGNKYKELQLKDRLPQLSEDEQLELLASDGMLIKRPLLTDGEKVTLGYDPDVYQVEWKKRA